MIKRQIWGYPIVRNSYFIQIYQLVSCYQLNVLRLISGPEICSENQESPMCGTQKYRSGFSCSDFKEASDLAPWSYGWIPNSLASRVPRCWFDMLWSKSQLRQRWSMLGTFTPIPPARRTSFTCQRHGVCWEKFTSSLSNILSQISGGKFANFPPDHGCVRRWLVYVSVNKFHRKEKCDKHQWTQWVPDVQQTHKIPWLVGKNWLETNRYCCTPFWSKSRYRYQYLHVSAPWGHGWTCHVAVFTIFAYCIPVCSFDD